MRNLPSIHALILATWIAEQDTVRITRERDEKRAARTMPEPFSPSDLDWFRKPLKDGGAL